MVLKDDYPMTRERKLLIWAFVLVFFGVLLHALTSILLPFIAGMLIAYFLDPVADKLEEKGLSRGLATTVILLTFFAIGAGSLMILLPLLADQVVALARMVPDLVDSLRGYIEPLLKQLQADLPPDAMDKVRENIAGIAQNGAKVLTGLLGEIWSGGLAFFNALSLLIITPVVAFYLLRDWDIIVAKVDSWLPRPSAEVIRTQFRNIDQTLAAFVRGQASVCLVLGLFYGIGLTLIGLKSGLLVGIGAGFISFIPYVGAAIGLSVGLAIALFQFSEWLPIVLVVAVFVTGQTAESYFLTPNLVGDRVGLHPVWIIFALLAGGALFGFIGVLIALPVAAVIGVLVRFSVDQYMESPLYSGGGE